jgi:hypothetical protein
VWFDVRAKLAEIEGRPLATSATTATQAPTARPVSQLSQVSQPPVARKRASRVAVVASVATPPAAESAIPLDPEGLPFAACPACGGGDWWKPAALPPAGPGWACATCTPPPGRSVAACLRGAGGGAAQPRPRRWQSPARKRACRCRGGAGRGAHQGALGEAGVLIVKRAGGRSPRPQPGSFPGATVCGRLARGDGPASGEKPGFAPQVPMSRVRRSAPRGSQRRAGSGPRQGGPGAGGPRSWLTEQYDRV